MQILTRARKYLQQKNGKKGYERKEESASRRTARLIEEMGEDYFVASQWTLMRRKFAKHRLAKVGGIVMIILAASAIFCEFFSPYDVMSRHMDYIFAPPQRVHIFDNGRLTWPFVYEIVPELDMENLLTVYTEDESKKHPIQFFYRGEPYRFLGLFETRIRFFGVDPPAFIHLFGTDHLGRDLYSRILFAARISMSVGLVGVAISFVLGCLLGGISGYYGGAVDMVIQRTIEFLNNMPRIPLWMALSAALPPDWPVIRVYFGITIILSIIGWTGLARVVRGKLLANRMLDYVLAAKIAGTSQLGIIRRHLLPSFISHLIVSLTLSIPGMILGETSLSFLGIGMRPPAVSWGVLLQNAQNIRTVAFYPWIMIPGIFVVVFVLAFNFLGDGLRDAADPYK